jgi:tetratricopeptide (TPR) repeat protein
MKAATQQAIDLDSTLAEAHHRLASIRTWGEWDWEGGEAAFRRSIQLKPNNPQPRAGYSHLLMILGRPDEAMAQIERALESDPFNNLFQSFYGVDLLMARRYDEAIAQFQNARKTAPNNPIVFTGLQDAFYEQGRFDEALAELEAMFAADGERELEVTLERGYAEGGYREAMRRVAEARAARASTTFVPPLGLAGLFAHAGEPERVLEWLENAYEAHDPNLPYVGAIPLFDIVRDDPRFQDLLRRMNLPQ